MQLKNAVKNSFFGVLGQIVLIVVGFFCQRTMNLLMGAELVGMNSVISNIIALLSVTELGIATAVVYNLYSAIHHEDKQEIAALMNLYRKAYYAFAAVIMLLGLIIMPFVHLFLKDVAFSNGYVRLVFFMWLLRTALSYLLSYKRSMLIADQREYVVSIVVLIVNVLNYSSTILILELTRNYVLALGVNILVEAASNIWIALYVNRKYPFLVSMRKEALKKDVVGKVVDNIKNIFVTRLFSKLLLSTDSLIISRFVSTFIAGLHSNYYLVIQSLVNIMVSLSGAIKPSLGHLFLEQDREKDVRVLRMITFLFFMIGSTASVCFFCLITPFVRDIWLNEGFLMGIGFVAMSVAQFYLMSMELPIAAALGVTGLFKKERNMTAWVAFVNLAVSLLLVKPLGIYGVIAGTIAAYLVQTGCKITVFFRDYAKETMVPYLKDMAQYFLLTCAETAVMYQVSLRIYRGGGFRQFVLTAVVCGCVPILVNILLYLRNWRMKEALEMLRSFRSSR